MKELLVPYKTGMTKTRIGRNSDGGYIVLKELFEKSLEQLYEKSNLYKGL